MAFISRFSHVRIVGRPQTFNVVMENLEQCYMLCKHKVVSWAVSEVMVFLMLWLMHKTLVSYTSYLHLHAFMFSLITPTCFYAMKFMPVYDTTYLHLHDFMPKNL